MSADKECYRQTRQADFAFPYVILDALRALEKIPKTLTQVSSATLTQ